MDDPIYFKVNIRYRDDAQARTDEKLIEAWLQRHQIVPLIGHAFMVNNAVATVTRVEISVQANLVHVECVR